MYGCYIFKPTYHHHFMAGLWRVILCIRGYMPFTNEAGETKATVVQTASWSSVSSPVIVPPMIGQH